MKRVLLILAPTLLLAGCVVRYGPPVAYRPAPAPATEVWYFGEHFIPESEGGGWCYLEGAHTHFYGPDRDDWYEQDGGYWYYRGPLAFTYYTGHPMPGGGWCYIAGPHVHDYYPPRSTEWVWRRGQGYVYQGPYRADRPPPVHYWPRPLPVPPRVPARPGYEYRTYERPPPPRPGPVDRRPGEVRESGRPAPAEPQRPFPRPEPRPPMPMNEGERGGPPPHATPSQVSPGHAPPAPAGRPGQAAPPSGRDRVQERIQERAKEKDDEKKKDDHKRPVRAPGPDHD